MDYRRAQLSDLDTVVSLSRDSFFEDPLYKIIRKQCKDEEAYKRFITISQRLFIETYLIAAPCFVAEEKNEIVAFAILEKPNNKKLDFITYIRNGGLKLLSAVSVPALLGYMRLLNQVMEPCETIERPNWYLAHLAVSRKHQGQNIGSRILKDCIHPYVKNKKGSLLTLVTHTELNTRFYKKNGFSLFDHRELKWRNQRLDNWSFQMEV